MTEEISANVIFFRLDLEDATARAAIAVIKSWKNLW